MTMTPDSPPLVELTAPAGRGWAPVIRLVLGGIADKMDLGFDRLDDLQLAVEQLLVQAGPPDSVRLSFELLEGGLRTRIGPLREAPIAEALQGPLPQPGQLGLRRILETVVDSYGVEQAEGGSLMVRLDTVVGPR